MGKNCRFGANDGETQVAAPLRFDALGERADQTRTFSFAKPPTPSKRRNRSKDFASVDCLNVRKTHFNLEKNVCQENVGRQASYLEAKKKKKTFVSCFIRFNR